MVRKFGALLSSLVNAIAKKKASGFPHTPRMHSGKCMNCEDKSIQQYVLCNNEPTHLLGNSSVFSEAFS